MMHQGYHIQSRRQPYMERAEKGRRKHISQKTNIKSQSKYVHWKPSWIRGHSTSEYTHLVFWNRMVGQQSTRWPQYTSPSDTWNRAQYALRWTETQQQIRFSHPKHCTYQVSYSRTYVSTYA